LNHSKDYKIYKEAWKHFIHCKDIDELDDDELKLLYSYDFIPVLFITMTGLIYWLYYQRQSKKSSFTEPILDSDTSFQNMYSIEKQLEA
jgi:hypothetical protein